jgi:Response regulator containing a CheY-like receiver domain and an HD-GYP domain
MMHHSSYGLPAEFLDIMLVEDSKPMQIMLRSMLMALRPRRLRSYDSAEDALEAMLVEPPNLVITDWRLGGMSGYQLLRTIRMKQMAPLSFVPVLIVSAHATRAIVEKAFRAGANHFLVKPISPACLATWVQRVTKDGRRFTLADSGHFVIEGVEEALSIHRGRHDTLERARMFHDRSFRRVAQIQTEVDKILSRAINPAIADESEEDDGPVVGRSSEAPLPPSHGFRRIVPDKPAPRPVDEEAEAAAAERAAARAATTRRVKPLLRPGKRASGQL